MCLDRLDMSDLLGEQYYSIRQDPYVALDDPDFLASLDTDGYGFNEFEVDPAKVKDVLANCPLSQDRDQTESLPIV